MVNLVVLMPSQNSVAVFNFVLELFDGGFVLLLRVFELADGSFEPLFSIFERFDVPAAMLHAAEVKLVDVFKLLDSCFVPLDAFVSSL